MNTGPSRHQRRPSLEASALVCLKRYIDPAYLGVLVMVGANKSRFKPSVKAIMERYYQKYRGKGGIEPGEADDPLLSGGAPAPTPAPA